jgi:hypothetical protein
MEWYDSSEVTVVSTDEHERVRHGADARRRRRLASAAAEDNDRDDRSRNDNRCRGAENEQSPRTRRHIATLLTRARSA